MLKQIQKSEFKFDQAYEFLSKEKLNSDLNKQMMNFAGIELIT